jgi:hypothetical protein
MYWSFFFLPTQTGRGVAVFFYQCTVCFQVPSLWTETVKDSSCVSRTRPGLTASWAGSSSAPQVSSQMEFALKGPRHKISGGELKVLFVQVTFSQHQEADAEETQR